MRGRMDGMPNTPHNSVVRALARIDQLVTTAQLLINGPDVAISQGMLVLLKEMQVSMEVAEVATRALGK
jgi:hypothetical protein